MIFSTTSIVLGNDFPFAKVVPIVAMNLRKYIEFSEEKFEAIDYKNCLELFPHLGQN